MSDTSDIHIVSSSVDTTSCCDDVRNTSITLGPGSPPHRNKEEEKDVVTTSDTAGTNHSFLLGRTRICDNAGYRGTVMYVGPVTVAASKTTATSTSTTNKEKIYAGIVWDDPTRGKHNGTLFDPNTNQWVQYFKIPSSYYDTFTTVTTTTTTTTTTAPTNTTATCASFVPIHKVHRGIALTKDVILSKYVPMDSTECVAPNTILPNCTVQCGTSSSKSTSFASSSSSRFHPSRLRQDASSIDTNVSTTTTTSTTRYKPIQLIGEYNIRRHQQLEVHHNHQNDSNNQHILRQLHTISLRSYQLSSIDVTDLLQWTASSSNDHSLPVPLQPQPQFVTHTIYEIDVAGNLFGPDWSSVHDILQTFPNVVKLSVAANFIYDYTPPPNICSPTSIYRHDALQHLNLNGTKLQYLSTIHQIGQTFPNLQELILANNQWDSGYNNNIHLSNATSDMTNSSTTPLLDQVLHIATALAALFTHLTLLDCSNCHLNFWSASPQQQHPQLPCDTSVDVNADGLCHVSDFNNITETKDDDCCDHRYNLFLLLWSKLPKLQHLSWDDNRRFTKCIYPYCGIETEQPRSDDNATRLYFPSLQQLQCVHTGITDWMDIVPIWDESIPTLRNVRFKHCPLVQGMSVSHIRHQLIGHCPFLNMINATSITEQERREVAKQVIGMSNTHTRLTLDLNEAQSHLERHRKYDYWVVQYPDIASSILEQCNRDHSPTSTVGMTSSHHLPFYTTNFAIVNVTFRSMAASSCTTEPFTRRLPTQMTIRKVKALCARQFDTELDNQILYFSHASTTGDNSIPQILDCNDHTLHYYGVPDGAEILMHEITDQRSKNVTDDNIHVVNVDENEHQTQQIELDQRLDRLEKEMYDFKLRQKLIAKK